MDEGLRYRIALAESPGKLEKFVQTEISHGWRPTGGLAVYSTPSKEMLAPPELVFMQALIKEPK